MPCDLCGEIKAYPLPQAETYGSGGVFVCAGCGFVHVKERRPPEEVAKAWDDIYGEGYTSAWPTVWARLQYVAEWYGQKYGWEGKRVLEIGAGEGTFLKMVRGRGAQVMGVEPSARNCEKLIVLDIPAYCDTIESVTYKTGLVDVVCILWTLENCSDCIGMLSKARELLKPGGHVLVATGSRILVPFKKPIQSYFSHNPPDTHCFRWSFHSLVNAFAKGGFGGLDVNDYEQCDWMVMAGTPSKEPLGFRDDPQAVLDYFARWEAESLHT